MNKAHCISNQNIYEETKYSGIAQLVAYLTTDPGIASSNPSLAILEIDHEIISVIIFHLKLRLIMKSFL